MQLPSPQTKTNRVGFAQAGGGEVAQKMSSQEIWYYFLFLKLLKYKQND